MWNHLMLIIIFLVEMYNVYSLINILHCRIWSHAHASYSWGKYPFMIFELPLPHPRLLNIVVYSFAHFLHSTSHNLISPFQYGLYDAYIWQYDSWYGYQKWKSNLRLPLCEDITA